MRKYKPHKPSLFNRVKSEIIEQVQTACDLVGKFKSGGCSQLETVFILLCLETMAMMLFILLT